MTFDRFRFCKVEYRGNPTKQRGTPKRYCLAIGGRTSTLHRKVLFSSPVFCDAKYRGGVMEVTEGLTLTVKKLI